MSSPRAVIFDLDGTLADSAPDIAAALNTCLEGLSLKTLPLDVVKSMVGGGARLLCQRALTANGFAEQPKRVEALLASFLESYRARPCVLTKLYPGARDVLADLASRGVVLGICTNKPDDLTQAIVDGLNVRSHFKSVIGSMPGLALKPAPGMLLTVCHALGVSSAEAIMVGDSAADLGAARATGMPVILLAHGYSAEPVETLGADAVLPGFDGLCHAIATLRLQSF